MNELYVLVDSKQNLIISPIMELPLNWGNINGLKLLSDEKLKDLSWAGKDGLGWKKITDPDLSTIDVTDEWLSFQKSNFKQLVSSKRKELENEILTFKSKQIKLNERVKNSLSFKLLGSFNDTDTLAWKFMNGTFQITYAELKELFNFINTYVQDCFDVEYEFSNFLDTIKDKNVLLNMDINLKWPDTTI